MQSNEIRSLKTRVSELETDYRVRSRAMLLYGSLDLDDEDDRTTFDLAKTFAISLSELGKLGEESTGTMQAVGRKSQLIDIDGTDGALEMLLLTQTFKSSPGWDRSVVAIFDADKFVAALPVETYYRTWHEIIVEDINSDGVLDVRIQKYLPGKPAAKRQVTEEIVCFVNSRGFTKSTAKNAK